MSAFFITGTDTDCGKTAVTTALLKALSAYGSVAGYKPVAAGCEQSGNEWQNDDALMLQKFSSPTPSYAAVNPYAFPAAIAPHIAAEQVGASIDPAQILQGFQTLKQSYDHILVEGAGGWRVPLTKNCAISDLPQLLGVPVILVVGLKLGCINHATLSAESILSQGIKISGWIGNQIDPNMPVLKENVDTLQAVLGEQLGIPMIAEFEHQSQSPIVPKQLNLEALLTA